MQMTGSYTLLPLNRRYKPTQQPNEHILRVQVLKWFTAKKKNDENTMSFSCRRPNYVPN